MENEQACPAVLWMFCPPGRAGHVTESYELRWGMGKVSDRLGGMGRFKGGLTSRDLASSYEDIIF